MAWLALEVALQVLAGDRQIVRGFIARNLFVLIDFCDIGDLLVLFRADPFTPGDVAGLWTGLPKIFFGPGAQFAPAILAGRMETATS